MDIDSDSESEAQSTTSFPPHSLSGSMISSLSSYEHDPDVRSGSPVSVISMSSSMRAAIYREEYGRNLNNYSDVYRLPADEEELNRLDKQHDILTDVMGGKFVPPMASVLAADEASGETKACLDLGCGSGNWILDVARDFPHCSAVAVDLIPMQVPSMPQNLRSEVDDINLGLEHYYGDFNVVHARLISSGIKDYHRLVDQISRVLRPGGLIDVSEFDFYVYDKHHRRIEQTVDQFCAPWWSQWMTYMRSAVKNIGGDTDAAAHLHEWISSNPRFEDVVYREFFLPVVPPVHDKHNENAALRRFEQRIKDDITAFLGAGRPLLLGSGYAESVINQLEVNCLQELEERKILQFTRLQCVYARRKSR